MMFAFLFLIFIGVAAGMWFHGAWKNAMYLVCILLAAVIATNFFEPTASMLEGVNSGLKYIFDFLCIWLLFTISFLILRFFCDLAGGSPVKFPLPAEMTIRTILALWSSWIFVCFTAFTLHMAPLNSPDPFGAWADPNEPAFLFVAPDRLWMGFAHSRSKWALSRGNFDSAASDPEDANPDVNVQPFDSKGDFLYKYHQRREAYAKEAGVMAQ